MMVSVSTLRMFEHEELESLLFAVETLAFEHRKAGTVYCSICMGHAATILSGRAGQGHAVANMKQVLTCGWRGNITWAC